jgi:hypothetical protein
LPIQLPEPDLPISSTLPSPLLIAVTTTAGRPIPRTRLRAALVGATTNLCSPGSTHSSFAPAKMATGAFVPGSTAGNGETTGADDADFRRTTGAVLRRVAMSPSLHCNIRFGSKNSSAILDRISGRGQDFSGLLWSSLLAQDLSGDRSMGKVSRRPVMVATVR